MGEIRGEPFEFPDAAFAPLGRKELREWGLFDRLLAAQAIEAGLTVLTPDQAFAGLGASRLW